MLPKPNINEDRLGQVYKRCFALASGDRPSVRAVGTMALATNADPSQVTVRTNWHDRSYGYSNWGVGLLDFWEDFGEDGQVDSRLGSGEE